MPQASARERRGPTPSPERPAPNNPTMDTNAEARRRLLATLAGHLVTEIGGQNRCEPAGLVVADGGGAVTLPMHHDLEDANAWAFAAPTELRPTIELALEPAAADADHPSQPTEAEADRWLAYHGSTPPGCRLVSLTAGFARYADDGGRTHVADDALTPNPLRSHATALCKLLNGDRAGLADACARAAGVRPAAPVAVGVDEWGVHVKAAFDVLRLGFDEPAMDEAAARRAIGAILEGAGHG